MEVKSESEQSPGAGAGYRDGIRVFDDVGGEWERLGVGLKNVWRRI